MSYSDHSALVKALDGVHTVISCIFAFDQSEVEKVQIALLEAAKEAGCKRFAPSEFALKVSGEFRRMVVVFAEWNDGVDERGRGSICGEDTGVESL